MQLLFVFSAGVPALGIGPEPAGLGYCGIYGLREAAPELRGSDVNIAVICRSLTYVDGVPQNDYRPASGHSCFESVGFRFHDSNEASAGISGHSTAICSILFGEDVGASEAELGDFTYQGILPEANADVYEFWHFLTDYVFGQVPMEADIITASIGSNDEDWWTRGIESLVEHQGKIVVAGIGNGSGSFDPPLYPAASSNVIGVGVIDSVDANELGRRLSEFSLVYPEHSSFGPTGDGRSKPDIVAVGNFLVGDVNDADGYRPTNSGSSFSTPVVAGAIGLLVEKARQEEALADAVSVDGGNCVMKAIVLNSATKLNYWHKGQLTKDDDHSAPLDLIQGAGMLDALGAYRHLVSRLDDEDVNTAMGWDNNVVDGDNLQNSYRIRIDEGGDKVITATVAWNRHYADEYPFAAETEKDGNLRLEVWGIDVNDPGNNRLIDYSDSAVDNVEHIYTEADANYSDYELIVRFSDSNVPEDGERYGFAWSVKTKAKQSKALLSDLNADGIVNDLDTAMMFDYVLSGLQESGEYQLGDINDDGIVDINDLAILINYTNRDGENLSE